MNALIHNPKSFSGRGKATIEACAKLNKNHLRRNELSRSQSYIYLVTGSR